MGVRWFQMGVIWVSYGCQRGVRLCQMDVRWVSDGVRWYQMVSDGFRWVSVRY